MGYEDNEVIELTIKIYLKFNWIRFYHDIFLNILFQITWSNLLRTPQVFPIASQMCPLTPQSDPQEFLINQFFLESYPTATAA